MEHVNGIDVPALLGVIEEIGMDPKKGLVRFQVATDWKGQTRSETRTEQMTLGGEKLDRPLRFSSDEPEELCGGNAHPNPQEYLLGAMNACMIVGYAAGAAVRGITLESLSIETDAQLDLRGFLGIDESVAPGYETIRATVRIKGDGTPEQFEEIHETVRKTSPNYFNIASPIRLETDLVVE